MERDKVAGRRKVRKPNRARGSPVIRPGSPRAFDLYARSPIHTLHGRGLPHGEATSKRRESGANCILLFGSTRTGGLTTEPHRKVFHQPGFLRFIDRASRAQARSVDTE